MLTARPTRSTCWPQQRLVVEIDGAGKDQEREAVIQQKLREDAIRNSGWRPYRFWAANLWTNPRQFLTDVQQRLNRW